jgi:toxin ParE1/3/4
VKVRLKARARADLLAIRAWGEDRWGPARTRDFLEGLIEAIERLVRFPGMGRPRDVFAPGLRSVRHRGHVIFYLIEDASPVVVAVLHERRNHAALDFADRIEGE